MVVNQVYPIVNSIARQMYGTDAVTVTDLTGLVSLGKQVLNSSTDKDLFLNVLADRIGKTIIRTLDMELEFPNLMVNEFEWGAIIQKINIRPFTAKANKSYQVGENGFTPSQFEVDKVSVSQTFFTNADAWEFDWTIPDTLLKTAFVNEQGMVALFTAMTETANDDLVISLNNMAHLCINNFIAEKIKNNNGIINPLAMYNEQFPNNTLTVAQTYGNKEFARYFSMTLKNYINYLGIPSTKYNVGGERRVTKRDNMHIFINSAWASMFDMYLSSETFHNELVKLPNYKEFVCLQGVGDSTNDWLTDTTINIVPSSGGDAINQSGIVCILADRQAIFTGYEDMFTATDRNNRQRYTNFTSGCCKQFANDLSENGLIFIIE